IIRGGSGEKLAAAKGETDLAPSDLVPVLYFLCADADPAVKRGAVDRLRELPEEAVIDYIVSEGAHPKLIDMLARLHFRKPGAQHALSACGSLLPATVSFLAENGIRFGTEDELPPPAVPDEEGVEEDQPVDEESEEFRSKYQQAQTMGVGQKIKMALTGDKEWRSILFKDANKLVNGAVVKNPRITIGEVAAIVKGNIQNDEVIRVITLNREWMKNYQIRKGLVTNHRTPAGKALRLMTTLNEKDLAALAKSKNISTVIATNARKLLLQKKER
ncbi:MAG TPA: hypothetical protein VNX25_07700, partial [Verrucomicrobiae bacterium]|nr:hypothetical protein [Verrucomicrobiae bacterium]